MDGKWIEDCKPVMKVVIVIIKGQNSLSDHAAQVMTHKKHIKHTEVNKNNTSKWPHVSNITTRRLTARSPAGGVPSKTDPTCSNN